MSQESPNKPAEREFNPKLKSFLFSLPILIALIVISVQLRPDQSTDAERLVKVNVQALGTSVWVFVYSKDSEKAHAAIHEAEQRIRGIHSDWSPTPLVDGTVGELAKVNQALLQGQSAPLPARMARVFVDARELTAASQGYFDPGMGRLVTLWGLAREPLAEELPDFAAVRALVGKDSIRNSQINDGVISANQPMSFDFGAYVKGTAVELAIDALRRAGIKRAMVNAGGDLKVMGHGLGDEQGWPLAIADPNNLGQRFAGFVALPDEAVFTSGNYLRAIEKDGKRYHHLLNPKTGFPAEGLSSVTVIHEDAAFADGAATALFVAGDQWQAVATQLGLDRFVVIDAQRNLYVSKAMETRLKLKPDVSVTSTVIVP